MKIILPKKLRGFAYDRVLPIDPNDFELDLLLPSIFFRVISGGQDRGRKPNDPTKIQEYVKRLAEHPDIEGFDDAEGLRLLERLVRTSIVQVGRHGKGRRGEQIDGINSYSLLAFKPEFPTESSRLRRVDLLIYRMMRDQMRGGEQLYTFFRDVFGKGVAIRRGNEPDGVYDGSTELDTLTRTSLSFLDGFATTGVRPSRERPVREAMPAVAQLMARDLRRYLQAYHNRMPVESLSYYLKGLIGFELFIYSMKLFYALPGLVENPGALPPAMRQPFEPSSPDLYLDFTGSPSGLSRTMAANCVRRDLEMIQSFITANLTLRHLDRYIHRMRGDRRVGQVVGTALADDEGGPAYLQALLLLLENPSVAMRVDAAAQEDEEAIRAEHAPDAEEGDESEADKELDRVAASAESDFQRVILLLAEGQRTSIAEHLLRYYWRASGLAKRHGILAGTTANRQGWRYAPGNDLLAMLVQLAAVDIPRWENETPAPQPIGLGQFLGWLEERFGILVDRPPEGFVGAEYMAAAQENLRAMLRRLRQMGVFHDLSDDFTVQRLLPPYVTDVKEYAAV